MHLPFSDVLTRSVRGIGLLFITLSLMSLSGCGSTKVYNSDKTLVFGDNVYNLSNVQVFASKSEAIISDTETIDVKGMEKKGFNKLLDQHDTVFISQSLVLDEKLVVYHATNVKSWSQFRKMNKQFASANEELQKFLANPKKAQLTLR